MNIPEKVIKRLTLYHFILEDYSKADGFISSTRIAELLNMDNSQVRKDIKYLNNTGKCRVGYKISELKKSIEDSLGFQNQKNAFIVGAGNLASALAKYDGFTDYGLNIVAMFDNDSLKVGNTVNGKKIFHISELPVLSKKFKADVAILTVPREYAQEIGIFLVNSGIKYIWNFTSSILDLPKNIKVKNENLIGNFLQFTRREEI